MHQVNSCASGAVVPSFSSAYRIEPVIPSIGSVSVPSRSKKTVWVMGRELALNVRNGGGGRPADWNRPGCWDVVRSSVEQGGVWSSQNYSDGTRDGTHRRAQR